MISQAFTILIVGMITVFLILWLIMLAGKFLILLTNHLNKVSNKPFNTDEYDSNTDPRKLAVISATVVNITHGMGKIERIQKIS